MFQAGTKEGVWWKQNVMRKVTGKRLVHGVGLADL